MLIPILYLKDISTGDFEPCAANFPMWHVARKSRYSRSFGSLFSTLAVLWTQQRCSRSLSRARRRMPSAQT